LGAQVLDPRQWVGSGLVAWATVSNTFFLVNAMLAVTVAIFLRGGIRTNPFADR
jgi:hypothetical protein